MISSRSRASFCSSCDYLRCSSKLYMERIGTPCKSLVVKGVESETKKSAMVSISS